MAKTNKKVSAKKKLFPAAGMLALSAVMLSAATYAWFTMSREVEVKNIQMTATVPEDMQISIGEIGSTNAAASTSESYTLAGSTGVLVHSSNVVTAPREAGTANDELDWSNSADISKYYTFGRLIPASSTDGEKVFYTPDATGVGRTLKENPLFQQANSGTTSGYTAGTDKAMATAHVNATNGGDSTWVPTSGTAGDYTTATAWNATNDDGYYVDIPVWLRTSSTTSPDVYVTGYVTKGSKTTDADADDVLYQAVRVAVLKDDGSADKGLLTLKDASASGATTSYNTTTAQSAVNILDSDNYNDRTSGTSGINAVSAATPSWAAVTTNDGGSSASLGKLSVGTGTEYGTSTKFIIRVWLEGEDGDCWNENAGQDWNISLKFSKEALPAT